LARWWVRFCERLCLCACCACLPAMSLESLVLERDGQETAWGFRLQGGKDVGLPLSVLRVVVGSPAEGVLVKGDVIVKVGATSAASLSHQQAVDMFEHAGNRVAIEVKRDGSSVASTAPLALQQVAPQLSAAADTIQSPQVAALPRTTFVPKDSLPAEPTYSKHGSDNPSIQGQGDETNKKGRTHCV